MPNEVEPAKAQCPTGISGLDDVLLGGLPRNRVYLVEGSPGIGKTTLALQFLLHGLGRGEKGSYITLSETREELVEVAKSHGWSLDSLPIFELSAMEKLLAHSAQNTLFHPADLELGRTIKILCEEVERVKPERLALDSLSELRLLSENSLRYRRQMLALKQFFAGQRCTVLLLDDHLTTSDTSDLQVQSIAHGVISLEKRELDYGAERRRIRVRKLRGVKFRSGSHDFVVETGGLKVFPRLVAAQHHKTFVREAVSSGNKEFDSLLGGGLRRGSSALFIGPAGSGKSSIALQYLLAAAERGEHSLAFCFDETLDTVIDRMETLGVPLQKYVQNGLIHLQQIDPAELPPGQLTHEIKVAVEERGNRFVLLDSLNGYLQSMPDERSLSLQLHELLTFLNQQGVVSLMTLAQHGLIGSMVSPVDVTYLTDCIILLRFFEAGGRVKRAIAVIKKRSGPHEDSIREYRFEAEGLRLGEPLTELRGVLTGTPELEGPLGSKLPESK